MKIFKICLLFIVAGSFNLKSLNAQTTESIRNDSLLKELDYVDHIIYKTVNGEDLKMIVIFPKNKKYTKTPLMFFTHGGGWINGDRYVVLKDIFFQPMKKMLDNGIACVSIEYRLNKNGNKVTDAVADCKDAAKYLIKNSDRFKFDTNKMGIWGGSAGGHLSLMAALSDDKYFKGDPDLAGIRSNFKCVVSYFPQTTFINQEILHDTNYFNPNKLEQMLGDDESAAKLLSPVVYIRKNNPPILLIHGTKDATLSYKNSTYFLSKAKQIGSDVTLLTLENGGHGLNEKNIKPTLNEVSNQVSDFIIKHLVK